MNWRREGDIHDCEGLWGVILCISHIPFSWYHNGNNHYDSLIMIVVIPFFVVECLILDYWWWLCEGNKSYMKYDNYPAVVMVAFWLLHFLILSLPCTMSNIQYILDMYCFPLQQWLKSNDYQSRMFLKSSCTQKSLDYSRFSFLSSPFSG